MDSPALSSIPTLRARAREHLEQGAVIQSYRGDRAAVLHMFNEALATELVCVLRYKRHACMAKGLNAKSIAGEFIEHATEEMAHADLLAARIVQLGGEPDFNPATLVGRSHAEYVPGTTLVDMLREDLVAERIAIDSYGEMVRCIGDTDPTSRRLLEGILAAEEEHAEDLASLLEELLRPHPGALTAQPDRANVGAVGKPPGAALTASPQRREALERLHQEHGER